MRRQIEEEERERYIAGKNSPAEASEIDFNKYNGSLYCFVKNPQAARGFYTYVWDTEKGIYLYNKDAQKIEKRVIKSRKEARRTKEKSRKEDARRVRRAQR